MQTLTLQPQQSIPPIIRCGIPRVYVDGRRRRDLQVLSWEIRKAPSFGRIKLGMGELVSGENQTSVENLYKLPDIDSQILVKPPIGFGQREFRGVVTQHVAQVTGNGESITAMVEHQLLAGLKETLLGRWELNSGFPVRIDETRLQFNTSSLALASVGNYDLSGRSCKVFDTSGGGQTWSVADALGYLMAAEVPANIQIPSTAELESLAGDIDLGEYEATGKTLIDALVQVAHRGGLEIRASRHGLGLVVYRPGQGGRRARVSLQKNGQDLDLTRSNLDNGSIKIGARNSQPPVRAFGAVKKYEGTFTMKPGWDPAAEGSVPTDYIRSQSSNWTYYGDVYRKWVLNEDASFDCEFFDFTTLADDFIVRRGRGFLSCVSVDGNGISYGVVVEYRLSEEGDWVKWTYDQSVFENQCTITLDRDELPTDVFNAAVAGLLQVRVTASVESDRRLLVEVKGNDLLTAFVYDRGGTAEWESILPTSIYYEGSGVAPDILRDDSAWLDAFANRQAVLAAKSSEATVTLAWTDTNYHVGDIVERLDGRELEITSQPDSTPSVKYVHHDFGETQQTKLILEG